MAKAKKRVKRSVSKRSERGRKVANNDGGWFAALMESQTGRTIAAEVLIAAAWYLEATMAKTANTLARLAHGLADDLLTEAASRTGADLSHRP